MPFPLMTLYVLNIHARSEGQPALDLRPNSFTAAFAQTSPCSSFDEQQTARLILNVSLRDLVLC